jgi:hypothetical protein
MVGVPKILANRTARVPTLLSPTIEAPKIFSDILLLIGRELAYLAHADTASLRPQIVLHDID